MHQVRPAVAVGLIGLLFFSGCFGGNPDVTESGKGRPRISVEFPERSEPSSVQTAVLEILNPGPGDMSGLSVSFTRVGMVGGQVPDPIVSIGSGGENPAVVDVEPEPEAVSAEGDVYVFEGLEEGASTTVAFELKVPEEPGVAANAVVVSDAREIDRSRGVPLCTVVGGGAQEALRLCGARSRVS